MRDQTVTLTDNGDGTTTIGIVVTVPIKDVTAAVPEIADQMGFACAPSGVTPLEFVGSQTRAWWASFAKAAALSDVEAAAKAAADATRQAGLAAIASSPLFQGG